MVSRIATRVMGSPNLDLVRSIYIARERGDFSSAEWADPEIEFVFFDGPSPGRWKGLAGMAEANRDWLSAWADVRQEVDEYREVDGERVLVLHRFGARGRGAGLNWSRCAARERRCSISATAG
jgi:hypothetical protein